MKYLIIFSLLTLSIGAFAQNDLSNMKEDATSYLNEKIDTLQKTKTCIQDAGDMEAFKACKYDMHKEMKMQKMESRHEKMMQEKHEKMMKSKEKPEEKKDSLKE